MRLSSLVLPTLVAANSRKLKALGETFLEAIAQQSWGVPGRRNITIFSCSLTTHLELIEQFQAIFLDGAGLN
jgi:hypothetical protein